MEITQAANFAGLLAWRQSVLMLLGLCATFPRRRPSFTDDRPSGQQALRRSGLRTTFCALQSRVGDGLTPSSRARSSR